MSMFCVYVITILIFAKCPNQQIKMTHEVKQSLIFYPYRLLKTCSKSHPTTGKKAQEQEKVPDVCQTKTPIQTHLTFTHRAESTFPQ